MKLVNEKNSANNMVRNDAAVTNVEVFGFLGWVTSALAYVLYVTWAFTPVGVLAWFGITYYPSKYWAIAVPIWSCVTVVVAYLVYTCLNTISVEWKTSTLVVRNDPLKLKYFNSSSEKFRLLPLVELPALLVNAVIENGVDPTEAELWFKEEMRKG